MRFYAYILKAMPGGTAADVANRVLRLSTQVAPTKPPSAHTQTWHRLCKHCTGTRSSFHPQPNPKICQRSCSSAGLAARVRQSGPLLMLSESLRLPPDRPCISSAGPVGRAGPWHHAMMLPQRLRQPPHMCAVPTTSLSCCSGSPASDLQRGLLPAVPTGKLQSPSPSSCSSSGALALLVLHVACPVLPAMPQKQPAAA